MAWNVVRNVNERLLEENSDRIFNSNVRYEYSCDYNITMGDVLKWRGMLKRRIELR